MGAPTGPTGYPTAQAPSAYPAAPPAPSAPVGAPSGTAPSAVPVGDPPTRETPPPASVDPTPEPTPQPVSQSVGQTATQGGLVPPAPLSPNGRGDTGASSADSDSGAGAAAVGGERTAPIGATTVSDPESGHHFCTNCGAKVTAETKFCGECGTHL